STRGTDAWDGRRRKSKGDTFIQARELFVNTRLNRLILFFRLRSLAPWFQRDKEKSAVSVLDQAEQAETHNAGHVLHAGGVQQHPLDIAAGLVRPLERRRVR